MYPQLVGVPHGTGQPNDGGMTTTEQNKAIIREFIDRLFTKGDLGAVDDLLAEDFVNHDPPFGASSDREGLRRAGAMFRAAWPIGTATSVFSSARGTWSWSSSPPAARSAARSWECRPLVAPSHASGDSDLPGP